MNNEKAHLDNPFGDDLPHLRRESFLYWGEIRARRRCVAFLGCQEIFQAAILQECRISARVRVQFGDAGGEQERLLLTLIAGTCWLLVRRIFHINTVLVLNIINHCFVAGKIHVRSRCVRVAWFSAVQAVNRKFLANFYLLYVAFSLIHEKCDSRFWSIDFSCFSICPITKHFTNWLSVCHLYLCTFGRKVKKEKKTNLRSSFRLSRKRKLADKANNERTTTKNIC